MIANNRGAHFIEFHSTDRYLLVRLREAIGSNHKIGARDRRGEGKGAWKICYRLQIGSKEWFADLRDLGFVPRKSLIMRFPKIPRAMSAHFTRGYFDGDGCVYFKKYFARDRNKLKWAFSTRFTSGSYGFLAALHTLLRTHGVRGGYLYTKAKNKGFELVLSHRDSLALYNLMYDTTPVTGLFLPRKYKIFRRAIDTLYPKVQR